jgi:hypothetical protein
VRCRVVFRKYPGAILTAKDKDCLDGKERHSRRHLSILKAARRVEGLGARVVRSAGQYQNVIQELLRCCGLKATFGRKFGGASCGKQSIAAS